MPSKPELKDAYRASCEIYGHLYMANEFHLGFSTEQDANVFSSWLSEHGWKAFQSFYELQEVKNEPSADLP